MAVMDGTFVADAECFDAAEFPDVSLGRGETAQQGWQPHHDKSFDVRMQLSSEARSQLKGELADVLKWDEIVVEGVVEAITSAQDDKEVEEIVSVSSTHIFRQTDDKTQWRCLAEFHDGVGRGTPNRSDIHASELDKAHVPT